MRSRRSPGRLLNGSGHRLRDWTLLLTCNLIWGAQFVIYKIVERQVGPVFAAFCPITLATLLLIPVVHREQRDKKVRGSIPARDGLQFILIGVFGQVVAQLFIAWGVRLTPASNAAVLVLALPVSTALMAYLILDERMTMVRWLSFIVALAGVLECSGVRWSELHLKDHKYLAGNLLIFLSITASGFYNVASKKLLLRYSPLQVVLYSYYVFVVVTLPIVIYTEPESFRKILQFDRRLWFGIILLALFVYFLAMILFLSVLSRLDATQAALSNYLIPLFGVLTAAIVLHERLTKFMVLGGSLVLAGTLLMTIHEERSKRASSAYAE